MLNIFYTTIFLEKTVFSEKTTENCFGGTFDHFYKTFFYHKLGMNILWFNDIFFKRAAFSEKTAKNCF